MSYVVSLWKGRIARDPLKADIERIFAEEAEAAGLTLTRLLNPQCRDKCETAARRRALKRVVIETGASISEISRKVGFHRRCVQKARAA